MSVPTQVICKYADYPHIQDPSCVGWRPFEEAPEEEVALETPTTAPEGLRLLADWFDITDAQAGYVGSTGVQDDLRKWAKEYELLDGVLRSVVTDLRHGVPPVSVAEAVERILAKLQRDRSQ